MIDWKVYSGTFYLLLCNNGLKRLVQFLKKCTFVSLVKNVRLSSCILIDQIGVIL